MVLAVVTTVQLAVRSDNRKRLLVRSLTTASIAAATSAHWWLPKVFMRNIAQSPKWPNDSPLRYIIDSSATTDFVAATAPGDYAYSWVMVTLGAIGLIAMCHAAKKRLAAVSLPLLCAAAVFGTWALLSKLPGQNWVHEARPAAVFRYLCFVGFAYLMFSAVRYALDRPRTKDILPWAMRAIVAAVPVAMMLSVPQAQALQSAPVPSPRTSELHDRIAQLPCGLRVAAPNLPGPSYYVSGQSAVAAYSRTRGCVTSAKQPLTESSTTYSHTDYAWTELLFGSDRTRSLSILRGHPALSHLTGVPLYHTTRTTPAGATAAAHDVLLPSDADTATGLSMLADLAAAVVYLPTLLDADVVLPATKLSWTDSSQMIGEYLTQTPPMIQPMTHDPVRSDHRSVDEWVRPSVELWATEHRQAVESGLAPESVVRLAMGGADRWPMTADESRRARHRSATAYDISIGARQVSFSVDRVGVPVLVRVTWHPRWKTDDASGPWLVSPGWMAVIPNEQHVTLRYTDDWISHVPYVSLGLLAAAGAAHGAVCIRRRRLTRS